MYYCPKCRWKNDNREKYYDHLQKNHPSEYQYHVAPLRRKRRRKRERQTDYERPRQELYEAQSFTRSKKVVRQRDENQCRECGAGSGELGQAPNCHHVTLPISPDRLSNEIDFEKSGGGIVVNHPDTMLQLCRECDHKAEHGEIDDVHLLAKVVRSAYRSSNYSGL